MTSNLEYFMYLNITCSIIGIVIFIYCILIIKKILNLFPKAKMRREWSISAILVGIFTGGYIINIIGILLNIEFILDIMQSFVYLFGAIFVFIIVRLSYKTYKLILESAKE
ncbi:MAG: hypothetical protein ACTSPY_01575 [Candidatus Helarchaeota archaeon]